MLDAQQLEGLQKIIRKVHVEASVENYIVELVRADV